MRALTRPRFLLAAALAGVAAGLIGIAMALLLEVFESLFYGVAHGALLERLAGAPPWRRALAPATGGLVAGGMWWWLRATGGVADVETAVADRSGRAATRMGLARPFLDAVTQVLTVGSGNSVGREGAPR
ncbi:Tat pathway signal sequence domain protein, partial [Actinomyces johnsonii F0510]